jgi:hypothetical protein
MRCGVCVQRDFKDVDGSLCFQRHTGDLGHALETVVIA